MVSFPRKEALGLSSHSVGVDGGVGEGSDLLTQDSPEIAEHLGGGWEMPQRDSVSTIP